MSDNLFNELLAQKNIFTPIEARIANAIFEDPQAFISYSMEKLSAIANVSQGSIINFSNKYAGGGFPVLKLGIAASLPEQSEKADKQESFGGVKGMLEKRIADVTRVFEHVLLLNSEQVLKRVAERILQAKKIEIYGIFRSACVASDFCYQLLQLGVPASFVTDGLGCAMSASALRRDSLVIAISSSGATKDVIDAVKIAKDRGVPAVCLTANRYAALAKCCDDVLVSTSVSDLAGRKHGDSTMGFYMLADALFSYLQDRIDETDEERYAFVRKILRLHAVGD